MGKLGRDSRRWGGAQVWHALKTYRIKKKLGRKYNYIIQLEAHRSGNFETK